MTYAVISLLLNILVTSLLGVTIFYCLKLNKRIRILQDSKSELAQLIEKFDMSTQQATYSIQEIHKASKKINENIQTKLDKANYLADDLAFMIEKANKMADRMEGNITSSRGGTRSQPASAPEPRSRAIREESRDDAEGPSLADKLAARSSKKPAAENGRGEKTLDGMMERLSELQGKTSGGKKVSARPRSRSEQELLEALKETKA
ncbi:MAG: DUF6468 domain-containing protein [Rickettsiales bacterium]